MKAFSTLIAMIFLLTFSSLIVLSMSTGLISRFQSSSYGSHANRLEITADNCREEIFRRLKNSLSYTGGQMTFPDGTCTVTVQGTDTSKIITMNIFQDSARKNLRAEVIISVSGEAINLSLQKLQEF